MTSQKWKNMKTILGQPRASQGSVALNNQVYVFGGCYVNQIQDNEEHLDYSRGTFCLQSQLQRMEFIEPDE